GADPLGASFALGYQEGFPPRQQFRSWLKICLASLGFSYNPPTLTLHDGILVCVLLGSLYPAGLSGLGQADKPHCVPRPPCRLGTRHSVGSRFFHRDWWLPECHIAYLARGPLYLAQLRLALLVGGYGPLPSSA